MARQYRAIIIAIQLVRETRARDAIKGTNIISSFVQLPSPIATRNSHLHVYVRVYIRIYACIYMYETTGGEPDLRDF